MAEISDLLVIDDNNVARWPEGMAFAQVNNSARADEGMLARWFQDTNGSLTTGGTSTAYTLTPNRTITSYYVGLGFRVQFNLACGAAPTINVSSLGAKNLTREGNVALNPGDIQPGRFYDIVYDGTEFQVMAVNLAPLTLPASGTVPLTLRRTENDTTLRKIFSVQSGSGAGNDYSINETGDGANNVVTVTQQIGATVIQTDTATSKGLPLPLDLTEVSTPAAPGAGKLRVYAKSGIVGLFGREGASGPETTLSALALPSAQGLVVTNNGTTPNTKIDVTVSQAILATSAGVPIFYSGGTNTIDLTVNGVNGLDTDAKANSTWYFVYLISDGTNFKALASTSSTAPTMPGGYIYSMRVGAMQTDGSGNLYRTKQVGRRAGYVITSATNTSSFPFTGTPTSSFANMAATGNGNACPSTAVEAIISMHANEASGSVVYVAPNGNYSLSQDTNPYPVGSWNSGNSATNYASFVSLLLESANIFIAGTGTLTNSRVTIVGWVDAVNAC